MKHASLIWIPSLLLACGVAQAHTPMQSQSPQQSQSAQQPQLKPASAQQTAACNKIANQLIGEMDKGDFATAAKSFEPKLGVDKGKLKKLWSTLSGKFGHVKSVGQSQQGRLIQGYTVLLVPVAFDKGNLAAQVACDSKGTVADLRFGHMPSSSPGTSPGAKPKS